jgi:hypothetical protein
MTSVFRPLPLIVQTQHEPHCSGLPRTRFCRPPLPGWSRGNEQIKFPRFRLPHVERDVCVISQAALYLASWLIAITSIPFMDVHGSIQAPNHAKGRILATHRGRVSYRMGTSPSCLSPSSTNHHNAFLTTRTVLLTCHQITRVATVAVGSMEEAGAGMAPQVTVTVVVVVFVAVVLGVEIRLSTTKHQPAEEYATFIGLLEPVIMASTARTSTRQGPSCLLQPHNPQITPPTSSQLRGWP